MNGMKNYLSNGGEKELDNFIQAFRAKVNLLALCQ